ncbi:glycosyltransferase family 4 protein [Sporosarcina sp. UB5]|uniref:glycosyltransferase family 4 protein n=1 Tax=Sporosarcina sp. UB5 TaxID=3047463 RepID=UPI003D7A30A1
MKILFVAPRFHTNQYPIVETLINHKHEVSFFAQYIGASEDHSLVEPKVFGYNLLFKFINILKKNLQRNGQDQYKFERNYGFPSIIKYYKAIKKFSPDIVIVRDRTLFSLLTFSICKSLKINTILYQQVPKYSSNKTEGTNTMYDKFRKTIYKSVVPKTMVTPINGKSENNRFTSKSIYYLPFIMKVDRRVKQKSFFRNNQINILSIGKFIPRKRHMLLIKVIEELKELYNIKLTIIGEVSTDSHKSEYKKAVQYIDENNLNEIVEIKTNLEYTDVQNEYLLNDLFILPSINEQLGVSILEAMANKLPVICSDSAGAKDYIDQGSNGYVFKSDDSNDLKDKIISIIGEKSILKKMGENSLELVETRYSPERYHSDLMELIDKEFNISMLNKDILKNG